MNDARALKLKGVLFSVLSAVIFGTSPIFFKTIVATVKSHLFRARDMLREQLKGEFQDV